MYTEFKIFVIAVMMAIYVAACISCIVIIKCAMRIMIEKIDAMAERLERRKSEE